MLSPSCDCNGAYGSPDGLDRVTLVSEALSAHLQPCCAQIDFCSAGIHWRFPCCLLPWRTPFKVRFNITYDCYNRFSEFKMFNTEDRLKTFSSAPLGPPQHR